ncbi:MAG: GNAT family N-acetyltransferase [Pirellulales bacterium]
MVRLPLTVDGCEVRSWRTEDAGELARHANNRKIWLNLRDSFPHPYTLDDAQQFLSGAVGKSPELDYCIAADDRAIGGIGLRPNCDVERFSAEIGYWLGEEFWGRGIVTAAVTAVTRHGFESLGYNRVFALPYARNEPSCRLLHKAGCGKARLGTAGLRTSSCTRPSSRSANEAPQGGQNWLTACPASRNNLARGRPLWDRSPTILPFFAILGSARGR